jgi:hypothetical protein
MCPPFYNMNFLILSDPPQNRYNEFPNVMLLICYVPYLHFNQQSMDLHVSLNWIKFIFVCTYISSIRRQGYIYLHFQSFGTEYSAGWVICSLSLLLCFKLEFKVVILRSNAVFLRRKVRVSGIPCN